MQALLWDYVDAEENARWGIKDEPSAHLVLKEINGYKISMGDLKTATPLNAFADLRDDGSTACGAWIYTGIYSQPPEQPKDAERAGLPPVRFGGVNRAASRKGDDWTALGWGFSWPANRRLMYNRCSADLSGKPWKKEERLALQFGPKDAQGKPLYRGYVYWDAEAVNKATGQKGSWVGVDVPDFPPAKPPTAKAQPPADKDAKVPVVGLALHDGASPFIMKSDGKAWLFAPTGLVDGPLPTHYEPYESPVSNVVYKQQNNPAALTWKVEGNAYAPVGSPDYPHVLSTYRLTEHHLSGTMSRWLPWLSELMPELFCELSPEHAAEIGVANTGWVTIHTPRGSIRAKALVTRRIRPFRLKERTVYHVGLPWHWGYKGVSTGDVVNNLSALVGDPNVTIHEAKVFVCQVSKG
jgi:formate dehydrogenase major subunit